MFREIFQQWSAWRSAKRVIKELRDSRKRAKVLNSEEALKRKFPQEWIRYREYAIDWAMTGIYFLKFPTFEEFLEEQKLVLKPEVQNFLKALDGDSPLC